MVLGGLYLVSIGLGGSKALGYLVAGLVGLAFSMYLVWRGVRGAMSRAVADGVVAHITGPATPIMTGGSRSQSYYLQIGRPKGPRFDIKPRLYRAIPEGDILTAYYLPRSKTLVNLEPDPTLGDSPPLVTRRSEPPGGR